MKRTRTQKKGAVAPLLSADLWSSDNTVHTHTKVFERVCVVMFGWAAGRLGVRACVCVRARGVLQTPPTRAEAPCGSLWGLDRCIVNPLTSESVPAGCGASASGSILVS